MMYDILVYTFSRGVNNSELHKRIRGYDIYQKNYDLKKIWFGFHKEIDERASKITAFNIVGGISALLQGN